MKNEEYYYQKKYLFFSYDIKSNHIYPENIYYAPTIKMCKKMMRELKTNQIRIYAYQPEKDNWDYYCDMIDVKTAIENN